MTETISLPLWLVLMGAALTVWALLDRLFLPGIRLYLRRRSNTLIEEFDKRLDLPLPAFKLIKRQVIIDRLMYDPQIQETVEEYCQENGASSKEVLKKVERYAKEIAPAFNALIYYRFGCWLCKSVARLLYRVRVGFVDEEGIRRVDPKSSIVFIMNHRSNMDYILLGFFASQRVVLSFAAGEWARVWPIQQFLRAMGAFFVRRGSGNPLYRCILARYVQMATEAGVVQAVFPEGKLSRDGRLEEPKIGLLDYMLREFDPDKERDLVFIPAGVNYDRIFEDRTLLMSIDPKAKQKSLLGVIYTTSSFIIHNLWLMLRGRWHRFGYAVVNFGTPLSMREYVKKHKVDFKNMEKEVRIEKVKVLAQDLMHKIGNLIPVSPTSLIAYVFAENPEKTLSELEIKARVQSLISKLEEHGAHIYIPRSDWDYTIDVGLRMLTLRHLVTEENYLYRAASDEIKLLRYYANAIEHLIHPDKPVDRVLSSKKSNA